MNPKNKWVNYKNSKNKYKPKEIVEEIIINPAQHNNPLWKHVNFKTKVKQNQITDFYIPIFKMSIIFLSLDFHYKFPHYIKEKLSRFVKSTEF